MSSRIFRNKQKNTASCCRYEIQEHTNYNTFNVLPCISVIDKDDANTYKNKNNHIIYRDNSNCGGEKCFKTVGDSLTDKVAAACVYKKSWSPTKSSKNFNEENIIEIEIVDKDGMDDLCERCDTFGDFISKPKNHTGITRESRKLFIICSSNFNPADFISDYSEGNTISSENLDSSGYGTHKSATRQTLLDGGDMDKNFYYDSCDETTPCCDNCASYSDGKCLSISRCEWVMENGTYNFNCSYNNICSSIFKTNDILPSEFYIGDLNRSQIKLWNEMRNNKKSNIIPDNRKKLFVPELHTCMWFDCISNSPNNPCKKYTEC